MNRTILSETQDVLWEFGFYVDEVRGFLENRASFEERQERAIAATHGAMVWHGKQRLLGWLVDLANVERGIRELEPWLRDHVAHALLTFLLGVYVSERFLKPRAIEIEPFQWKLAGLFHDVGYPVQAAAAVASPFSDKLNEIKRELGVDVPDLRFTHRLDGVDRLVDGRSSLDVIQRRISEWGLDIDAAGEYELMLSSGKVCHGMFSALALLYAIDLMYSKYNPRQEYRDVFVGHDINWNQAHFEEDIVAASAAIFVHNLPDRCFTAARIASDRAPLAFLLRLSDCLQDWERPSAENPRGFAPSRYDIAVDDGELVFRVLDDTRRTRIAAEVEAALVASGVRLTA